MNPLAKNDNCDFAKYFKELGYGYSWDFSRRDGLYWHEIYTSGGELILQVEMVPLERIIKDMCANEDVETGYFVAGDDEEEFEKLCDLVRAREQAYKFSLKTYLNAPIK